MNKKKSNYIRARVDDDFKEIYLAYCKKHSFVLSKRLRALMQMDINGEIKG